MRALLAAAAFALVPFAASAQSIDAPSGTYTLDKTHASIVWKIDHIGFSTYTAMFERSAIDATVELDADNIANSSVSVTLDGQEVATLHPGSKDFNADVESPMFLNTATYPEVTFVSTGIEVTGENTALITGDLTLNNVTLPFVLDTTLNGAAPSPFNGTPMIGISATGTLDRTEWGVDRLVPNVGVNVAIEVEGEFYLQQ